MNFLPDSSASLPLVGLGVAGGFAGVLLTWLLYKRWQYRRFVHQFDVLWDRKIRPFCPHCRRKLTDWQQYDSVKFQKDAQGRTVKVPATYWAFHCARCQRNLRLVDADGYEVPLEQAREQVVFNPVR
ncbi:hypothetical protein [Desulfuromonas sp. AOP6]|uniref:hypothetical protein n=1 Tax=Desulfuromonas sp. AOP6 TaxID=1566351 RepID=UPI0012826927|nr:hypothetical protein [Desulfuromonas sp. AOP6]BCA79992.1 hypothetical protein AOP6_1779 [Desulfuromonas sp. AOP6]